MFLIKNKISLTLIGCLILLSLPYKYIKAADLFSQDTTKFKSETDRLNGYTDIVLFKNRYFAVGTNGRIDSISKSGKSTTIDNTCKYKLNCAFANDEVLVAAGDKGTIMYSTDGNTFYHAESGTDKNIYGITTKNGLLIAGADSGTILSSANGKSWNIIQTEINGNIISLSSNNSFFIGVSDAGEIIKSVDGAKWEIKDYNKEYAGYNQYTKFKKILTGQNNIIIIGTLDDGSPSILFSTLGNVWAERIPVFHDEQGLTTYLANEPNGVIYDLEMDQFILACDGGVLFGLPACSKCNEYYKISETDLNAMIFDDTRLVIVGNGYSVFIQDGF